MAGHRAEMMKLMKKAQKAGCSVERTGSGHWKIVAPNGTVTVTSFSPKNAGALRDVTKELKKAGVQL